MHFACSQYSCVSICIKVKAKIATNPRLSEIDSTINVLAEINKKNTKNRNKLASEIIKHQFDEFKPGGKNGEYQSI